MKSKKSLNTSSNITVVLSILAAALIIGGAVYFAGRTSSQSGQEAQQDVQLENVNNVSIVDGKQIIEIKAKGGFNPVHSIAKAGIPTILRLNTSGTFDCTSVVRIPKMNIYQNLPPSGVTDVDLGTLQVSTIQGTCGMGMYPFDIKFE